MLQLAMEKNTDEKIDNTNVRYTTRMHQHIFENLLFVEQKADCIAHNSCRLFSTALITIN